MSPMARPRPLLLAPSCAATLLVGTALLAAGCDTRDDGSGSPTAAPPMATEPGTTGTETEQTTFAVYLARGEQVAPVRRRVTATPGILRAAVAKLLAGPSREERSTGYDTAVPAGTRLLGVSVADGTARVDLSGSFASGAGGSSMRRRVAQVVYTATQFPGVDRVSFSLEGTPATALGSADAIVDPPVTRSDFEDETPGILVESPLPGDTVQSPVRLRGTANVFEANVAIEVRGADGAVLLKSFATASSGTGTRGTFDTEVPVDAPPGPIVVVAYAPSGEDGSPLFPVELPLTLSP